MIWDAMWRLDLALLTGNEHDANAGFNGWTVWHAANRANAGAALMCKFSCRYAGNPGFLPTLISLQ